MSTTNTSLMGHLGRHRFSLDDNKTAGTASSQSGATAITSQVSRVTSAISNGSVILQDMLTKVAPTIVWVINDSANTIQAYPFSGQNVNGSLNAALAIAAGGFGFFSRVEANLDWRAQAFT